MGETPGRVPQVSYNINTYLRFSVKVAAGAGALKL